MDRWDLTMRAYTQHQQIFSVLTQYAARSNPTHRTAPHPTTALDPDVSIGRLLRAVLAALRSESREKKRKEK